MSFIASDSRFVEPQPDRHDIEDAARKLQDSCRRLQDILRRREEEMRLWEDEMCRFEDDLKRALYEELSAWKKGYNNNNNEPVPSSAPPAPVPIPAPPIKVSFIDAWNAYEEKWRNIQFMSNGLTFASIPWPVVTPIFIPESLNFHSISQFILYPDRSRIESPRRRILAALRRWHTDHFDTKILHKVVEQDQCAVKEGAGRVVRCLNRMLEEETFNANIFQGLDLE